MAKTAGIIGVGNEILSGNVADQDAAFLARELRALGVNLRKISVVADDIDEIAREVAAFSSWTIFLRAPWPVWSEGGDKSLQFMVFPPKFSLSPLGHPLSE